MMLFTLLLLAFVYENVLCDLESPEGLVNSVDECVYFHDGYHYDLSPLKDTHYPRSWTDSNGIKYVATFCDSYRLMRPHCPVKDAVAASNIDVGCEYYGRVHSLESINFKNDSDPHSGITLTYGDGDLCPGHANIQNRVTFVISCDHHQKDTLIFSNVSTT